jgi:hypothetical protein
MEVVDKVNDVAGHTHGKVPQIAVCDVPTAAPISIFKQNVLTKHR